MTEEEAKTKWCPKVRYLAIFRDDTGKREIAGCYNRSANSTDIMDCNCIASECMWWVWDVTPANAATENAYANVGSIPLGHCGAIK